MTINKLTNNVKPLDEIDKINEIIDELDNANVAIDNSTITKNTSDQLQTVAVKDNNGGNAIKTWTGTKSQYDAIVTKDATTIYNITDDTDVTIPLLEILYPVGAIYIGTMSVCPLAVLGVGTWQLKATDKVLQGAGTRGSVGSTVNESLPNITGTYIGNSIFKATSQDSTTTTGAFERRTDLTSKNTNQSALSGSTGVGIGFNASLSSSTYRDNAPVQQDAYLVNIWERIS